MSPRTSALFAAIALTPALFYVVLATLPGGRARLRRSGFQMARMAYRLPWQALTAGLALTVLGGLFLTTGHHEVGRTLTTAGLVVLSVSAAWWWLSFVARPHGVKALIRRRAEMDQRSGGVASRLDIAEHAGPKALRLKAQVLRPSLTAALAAEDASRRLAWLRRPTRVPVGELGVLICTLGWGWWGERLHSSVEDATMRIAGPRIGKTVSMACYGIDAPGTLITTSTRLDLAEMVHHARSTRGRVHVFNPAGLGGLTSTVRWRVLDGCGDFAVADRRATDLIPESFGEGERWDGQARRILALLLHAAAVTDRTMRDVTRWISDPTPKSRDEVVDALLSTIPTNSDPGSASNPDGGSDGGRDRAASARQFWATNDRTRTSITTTMATPLAWLSDDRARPLGDAAADDPALLDVTGLIQRGETLHLIGHEEQGALSPLIGALVAEIAHAARRLAAHQPDGRLDPPVTMLLDEAALVCPVPLDKWTADMGGRGVTLHIAVQSLSQLRQRWGTEGAGTILANVATFIVFGGSVASDDLRDISALTGEHRMKVVGADHHTDTTMDGEQRGEYRWVPVLSPAQIRALVDGQVLVLRRGLHVVVGWAPMIYNRKGWAKANLNEALPADTTVPTAAELEAMLQHGGTPEADSNRPVPATSTPLARMARTFRSRASVALTWARTVTATGTSATRRVIDVRDQGETTDAADPIPNPVHRPREEGTS